DLPLTVGPDAPQHTGGFLALLSDVPAVADRVDAMVRVGGRRWDLKLDNGIDIRLPEDGVAAALERLAALQQDERLLDRDIAAIDMRLADRLVIRPRPAGGTAAEDGEGTTGDDGP